MGEEGVATSDQVPGLSQACRHCTRLECRQAGPCAAEATVGVVGELPKALCTLNPPNSQCTCARGQQFT